MEQWIKTDLFRYTEYLPYLEDCCKANNGTDPATALYDLLVLHGGFIGRDFIDDMFGRKELTFPVNYCMHLSTALGHTAAEADYFRCLVARSQSTHENEILYFEAMRKRIADENSTGSELIDKNRNEFYSQWYHSAVRALIGTLHTTGDIYRQLREKMVLPVPEMQIQESVELLSRLGFIRKNDKGDYVITTEKNIKTGSDFSWEDKKQIHLQYLKLAEDILAQTDGPEQNKVSSHVLGISKSTFEQICTYTDELKKRINTLVENEATTDRVYLYQLVFVPLTRDCATEQ